MQNIFKKILIHFKKIITAYNKAMCFIFCFLFFIIVLVSNIIIWFFITIFPLLLIGDPTTDFLQSMIIVSYDSPLELISHLDLLVTQLSQLSEEFSQLINQLNGPIRQLANAPGSGQIPKPVWEQLQIVTSNLLLTSLNILLDTYQLMRMQEQHDLSQVIEIFIPIAQKFCETWMQLAQSFDKLISANIKQDAIWRFLIQTLISISRILSASWVNISDFYDLFNNVPVDIIESQFIGETDSQLIKTAKE